MAHKELQKIGTALAPISHRSMNRRGKTRELTTTPRDQREKYHAACGDTDGPNDLGPPVAPAFNFEYAPMTIAAVPAALKFAG